MEETTVDAAGAQAALVDAEAGNGDVDVDVGCIVGRSCDG